MQSYSDELVKGSLYMIICKANEMSIRISDTQNHKDSRISGAAPNPQDLSQLWFVDRTKQKCWEILNALSDYCFDEQQGEYRLSKPKWANTQLMIIQKSPVQQYYQYYWIKLAGTNKAVSLQGILRSKNFHMNDTSQLFRFEPIENNNNVLNKTVFLQNPLCSMVLDVPEASIEGGVRLIQWHRNGRFNQRWTLIKTGNAYQIRSFKSGLDVDINQQSKKPGAKIIQWEPTGSSNQLWLLENRGKGIFVIRSVHAPDLVLGIEGNNLAEGGRAVTMQGEFLWRIDGFMFK